MTYEGALVVGAAHPYHTVWFRNVYPLHQHEMRTFGAEYTLTAEGIYEPNGAPYYEQHGEVAVALLDRHPVGFACLASTTDRSVIAEFWVDPGVRGTGLAHAFAAELLTPGDWALTILEDNLRAEAFWESVLVTCEQAQITLADGENRWLFTVGDE